MNKAQLIDIVSSKADISKAAAGRTIDAMMESITESLIKEESVTLVGFGTFNVRDRAARSGRNPQTGSVIEIPASKLPSFKAGKLLKDALKS